MQRGRYTYLAAMAGVLAVAGWSGWPALADTPDKLPANLQAKATNLPAGWMASSLGTTDTLGDPQSVTVDNNGVWTIVAAGKDLWGTDDGGIIVYQNHTGDGSVSFRLLSQSGGQDVSGNDTGWVKTAPAFRESLDSGSRDVYLSASSGNDLEPSVRLNVGDANPMDVGNAGTQGWGTNGKGNDTTLPTGRPIGTGIWVGMDRHGNDFGYYWSNDGKVWTKVAGNYFELPADLLAGVLASAHKDDPTDTSIPPQTSKLDNVSVSNDLLAPKTISNIAYAGLDGGAVVTWNPAAVAGADVTYNVYQIDPNDVSSMKKVNTDPIKTASFMVTGLTNGMTYQFGVTAVVNGVESGIQLPERGSNDSNKNSGAGVTATAGAPILGGFSLVNIGTASPGSVTITSGTDLASAAIHMKASGWDIYQETDGFSFLTMPMAGDIDISARFVKGPTEDTDGGGWELGGPMIRETLDSGSRFAMAQIAATNQLQFKRRRAAYQTPTNTGLDRSDNKARPVTMRLVRKGNTFQCFYSEDDGKTWKDLGDPNSTALGSTSKDTLDGFTPMPYVGIALSGHTEGEFSEADIDHIVIKPAQ